LAIPSSTRPNDWCHRIYQYAQYNLYTYYSPPAWPVSPR
jgi:hypothetical protein